MVDKSQDCNIKSECKITIFICRWALLCVCQSASQFETQKNVNHGHYVFIAVSAFCILWQNAYQVQYQTCHASNLQLLVIGIEEEITYFRVSWSESVTYNR